MRSIINDLGLGRASIRGRCTDHRIGQSRAANRVSGPAQSPVQHSAALNYAKERDTEAKSRF